MNKLYKLGLAALMSVGVALGCGSREDGMLEKVVGQEEKVVVEQGEKQEEENVEILGISGDLEYPEIECISSYRECLQKNDELWEVCKPYKEGCWKGIYSTRSNCVRRVGSCLEKANADNIFQLTVIGFASRSLTREIGILMTLEKAFKEDYQNKITELSECKNELTKMKSYQGVPIDDISGGSGGKY